MFYLAWKFRMHNLPLSITFSNFIIKFSLRCLISLMSLRQAACTSLWLSLTSVSRSISFFNISSVYSYQLSASTSNKFVSHVYSSSKWKPMDSHPRSRALLCSSSLSSHYQRSYSSTTASTVSSLNLPKAKPPPTFTFCTAITEYLPMSLATKKMAKRYERQKQRQAGINVLDEDIDLFSRDRESKDH